MTASGRDVLKKDYGVLTRDTRTGPQHHDLYRQAYLLTGDPERAVRLADRAAQPAKGEPPPSGEQARTALVRSVVAEPGRAPGADHPDLPGWQALGRLTARRRAAIVLRFDEGLTEEHAATRLGTTPQTVRADVDAALLALRTTLTGAEDPWLVVTEALSTAGRRWSAAAGPPAQAAAGRAGLSTHSVPGAPATSPWRPENADPAYPVGPPGSRGLAGAFGSGGRAGSGHPVGLPVVTGPHRDPDLLSAGTVAPGISVPRVRHRRLWPVLAAGAVTVLVVLGAVLVPALRTDPPVPAPQAADVAGPVASRPERVPVRKVLNGLLNWPARGPLAADRSVEIEAGAAWGAAVRGAEAPARGVTLLWAGTLDGRRTAVLQALDRRGRPRLAQAVEAGSGFRLLMAEPLPGGTAVLSLLPAAGSSGPVRVLVSPEAQAADGLLAVNPMSAEPLRRFPVDAGGVSGVLPSPPGAPTCSRVVVLGLGKLRGRVGSGPRVLQSGIMTAEMMVGMSESVEVGSATLAPADGAVPDMTWFGDGKTLARKVSGDGTLVLAALGPRLPGRRLSAVDPRVVDSRAYELRRGGRTYLGSVVEIDGRRICASAWPADRHGGPAAFVLRCPLPGGTAGLVHVVAVAEVTTVSIALEPTPAPPGQRAWSGSVTRPTDQRSTSAFAALIPVPSGFPCGPGSVQVGGGGRGFRTSAVPVYVP
ncbi:MAG TPA: sigma factor-like helix-turn-helix DNA-binding protein [Mycobacteriales bacterium]